jgi:hypothetical protein
MDERSARRNRETGCQFGPRGLSVSQPRMRADTHDGPEQPLHFRGLIHCCSSHVRPLRAPPCDARPVHTNGSRCEFRRLLTLCDRLEGVANRFEHGGERATRLRNEIEQAVQAEAGRGARHKVPTSLMRLFSRRLVSLADGMRELLKSVKGLHMVFGAASRRRAGKAAPRRGSRGRRPLALVLIPRRRERRQSRHIAARHLLVPAGPPARECTHFTANPNCRQAGKVPRSDVSEP